MFKTVAAALVAVGLLGAPAFAQDTVPVTTQHIGAVKHTASVKTHKLTWHVAVRHHRKHVKQAKSVKYHIKQVKRHAKTLKHQANHLKHQVRKTG